VAAAALMAAGGLAGVIAITLFTVDSWYAHALPLWLAGAVLALLPAVRCAAPGPPTGPASRRRWDGGLPVGVARRRWEKPRAGRVSAS
jgi:hypothetical protein